MIRSQLDRARVRALRACFAAALMLLVAATLAACGDDASPQDKCEMLGDVLCDRIVECVKATGASVSSTSHSNCIDSQMLSMACDKAIAVSSSYDSCIDQLKALECDQFLSTSDAGQQQIAIPGTCLSSIQVSK